MKYKYSSITKNKNKDKIHRFYLGVSRIRSQIYLVGALKCIYQLQVFCIYKMSLSLILTVIAEKRFDYKFSLWCYLRLKFVNITSGFTLTKLKQGKDGNYHFIFQSMTSKAEFSSTQETKTQRADCFQYICHTSEQHFSRTLIGQLGGD